jgi:hypothetical protein
MFASSLRPNRNLPELIAAGQFREDLMYRLRVIHLEVPPLRDRREDIVPLVNHFARRTGRAVTFTDGALQLLVRHRWPGNVRELHNVVEQAVLMTDRDLIDVDQLPSAVRSASPILMPARERRRQVADELYNAIVTAGYSFWDHIYPLFLSRDITRHDMRELVRRGLATTRGNYRALLKLFGMAPADYKRFLNFLAAHDCRADFREFRNGAPEVSRRPALELPVLPPRPRWLRPTARSPASGERDGRATRTHAGGRALRICSESARRVGLHTKQLRRLR